MRIGDAGGARVVLDGVDATGSVLELRGGASFLLFDYVRAAEEYEQAYAAYRAAGSGADAARVARILGGVWGTGIGDWAVAGGWVARAKTLLSDQPTSGECGWVALTEGMFTDGRTPQARSIPSRDRDRPRDQRRCSPRWLRISQLPTTSPASSPAHYLRSSSLLRKTSAASCPTLGSMWPDQLGPGRRWRSVGLVCAVGEARPQSFMCSLPRGRGEDQYGHLAARFEQQSRASRPHSLTRIRSALQRRQPRGQDQRQGAWPCGGSAACGAWLVGHPGGSPA